jgi:hypothetical protein
VIREKFGEEGSRERGDDRQALGPDVTGLVLRQVNAMSGDDGSSNKRLP